MKVPFPVSAASYRSLLAIAIAFVFFAVTGIAYWYWIPARISVIIVTLDTTRADRLGAYGNENGLTEAFDEIAQSGITFDRAYAPCPVTLPSHATMLTGLYPPEHGLRVNGQGRLTKNVPMLPEIFRKNGYETAAFIAAAVLDSQYGLERGFDTYDDDLTKVRRDSPHGEARRDGKEVMDAALRWLAARFDKPFFCWIHLYDAHAPYDPRHELYKDRFLDNPYDAGIAVESQQLARLIDFLKSKKIDKNTLVVIAADHGEGLGDHGEQEHGMLVYDTTVRVPLVFAGPQICSPGVRVPDVVSLVDLAPTVLDIAGFPELSSSSGRSLVSAFRGESLPEKPAYAETQTPYVYSRWCPLYSLVTDRWKYIQTTTPELYDLLNDPHELNNLAGTVSDDSTDMRNALDSMRETFSEITARNLTLSEKDLENLKSLGYMSGGTVPGESSPENTSGLPDIKDMLKYVTMFEDAGNLSAAANYDAAIAVLQKLTRETDKFPVAELLLGDLLSQVGRFDEAETVYRSALSKRPDFLRAHFNLGRIYTGQDRLVEAEQEFRECVKLDATSAASSMELGNVLVRLGKADDAVEVLGKLTDLRPDFAPAHLTIARILMPSNPQAAAERLENAVRHVREILKSTCS